MLLLALESLAHRDGVDLLEPQVLDLHHRLLVHKNCVLVLENHEDYGLI